MCIRDSGRSLSWMGDGRRGGSRCRGGRRSVALVTVDGLKILDIGYLWWNKSYLKCEHCQKGVCAYEIWRRVSRHWRLSVCIDYKSDSISIPQNVIYLRSASIGSVHHWSDERSEPSCQYSCGLNLFVWIDRRAKIWNPQNVSVDIFVVLKFVMSIISVIRLYGSFGQ